MKRICALRSRYLVAYVASVDAALCFLAIPFELYCRTLIAEHRAGTGFLLSVLVLNGVLLLLMFSSAAVAGELVRRGFRLSRPSAR